MALKIISGIELNEFSGANENGYYPFAKREK